MQKQKQRFFDRLMFSCKRTVSLLIVSRRTRKLFKMVSYKENIQKMSRVGDETIVSLLSFLSEWNVA